MSTQPEQHTIALVGNPNAGKTTLFNALTGENQHVGNYSGVTVDVKKGTFHTTTGKKIHITDLPGCLSLEPHSPDEKLTSDLLQGKLPDHSTPDITVCVLNAASLERHLSLALEVIELGQPVVVALNMVDLAETNGIHLDPTILSEELGVPVVPIQANKKKGTIELKQAIRFPAPAIPEPKWETTGTDVERQIARTAFIKTVCNEAARRETDNTLTFSDKLDEILLHPILGWISLVGIMLLVFWSIFSLSSIPMDAIETTSNWLGAKVSAALPEGDLNNLIVDGIIAGIGGTIIFLPQIIILFTFIGLLESSGYMARAAFLMDRIMNKAGLSGKAFLPLLSSHACAIPGIMAARTIDSAKERLITILIAPWMSCSARLPVYFLLISMLLPTQGNWAQALLLFGIYTIAIITALITAKILRSRIKDDDIESHFMLELPPYRKPQLSYLLRHIWSRAWAFLKKAGTVILALSIILWALQTYPKPAENSPAAEDPALALEQSYMGQLGHAIEPVFKPLGFDWRTSTSVLTSFAAREVFVGSLKISYSVSDELEDDEQDQLLHQKLAAATWPDGRKIYTPLTLTSLLIFFIYALQCLPTTAVVHRETNSKKWAIGQLLGMSLFAYLAALLVYQIGSLLGF